MPREAVCNVSRSSGLDDRIVPSMSVWGTYLRLGLLDLADLLVKHTVLAVFLIGTAPCGNLPDELAPFMLGALLDYGVARIGTDDALLAVQQSATGQGLPNATCGAADCADGVTDLHSCAQGRGVEQVTVRALQ